MTKLKTNMCTERNLQYLTAISGAVAKTRMMMTMRAVKALLQRLQIILVQFERGGLMVGRITQTPRRLLLKI